MTLRVSLSPRRTAPGVAPPAPPLLDPAGASIILGGAEGFAVSIEPRADSLFGPRGVCFAGDALAVCDTGHHRLLIWRRTPEADGAPADIVIGQADFEREGRNGKAEIGPATLNVPTGIASDGEALVVADAWNHRVLIWRRVPERSNQPADIVLGQADFSSGLANRGGDEARADTLNWPYGVALIDGRLVVCDTGNRRVLIWNELPQTNAAPPDLVLGQRDFVHRDENAGEAAGPCGMRWGHSAAFVAGRLFVADAGDNRVMSWHGWPRENGAPCAFVLGQPDMESVDHNRAAYYPDATAMNMPYGAARMGDMLVVADTANSRLIGFAAEDIAQGAPACRIAGQLCFEDKGDNRWRPPARDSLCWPYGLDAQAARVAIADSGNNRVLIWNAAP